eukprot:s4015_g3.t1
MAEEEAKPRAPPPRRSQRRSQDTARSEPAPKVAVPVVSNYLAHQAEIQRLRAELESKERALQLMRKEAFDYRALIEVLEQETFLAEEAVQKLRLARPKSEPEDEPSSALDLPAGGDPGAEEDSPSAGGLAAQEPDSAGSLQGEGAPEQHPAGGPSAPELPEGTEDAKVAAAAGPAPTTQDEADASAADPGDRGDGPKGVARVKRRQPLNRKASEEELSAAAAEATQSEVEKTPAPADED